MGTPASDLRKWVQGRRLAETREKLELQDRPPNPAQALARGFALIAFTEAVGATARVEGGVPEEDLLAYRRWARIRTTLRVA